MIYEIGRHYFPLLLYTTARLFCKKTKSIHRYAFRFLNARLPSEATSLKTSIILVPGTVETRAPLIVLKTRTRVRAPNTWFLAVR